MFVDNVSCCCWCSSQKVLLSQHCAPVDLHLFLMFFWFVNSINRFHSCIGTGLRFCSVFDLRIGLDLGIDLLLPVVNVAVPMDRLVHYFDRYFILAVAAVAASIIIWWERFLSSCRFFLFQVFRPLLDIRFGFFLLFFSFQPCFLYLMWLVFWSLSK